MATYALTIGGTAVSLPDDAVLGKWSVFSRDGIPTLAVGRRAVQLAALPDPYSGKAVTFAVNGTNYFAGDVISAPETTWDDRLGWVQWYQCAGLRKRGNKFPHTDSNTGLNYSGFNLSPEDPAVILARQGRSVAEILTSVLTMVANAATLTVYGLGNLSLSLGVYSLPTNTANDLTAAAFGIIPQKPVLFGGQSMLGGVETLLAEWLPNHFQWVDPRNGELRFFDWRLFTPTTFTLDTDDIDPASVSISRRVGDCFQRVVGRGQPVVLGIPLSKARGDLVETFAHDGLTSAAAKAAFTPAQYNQRAAGHDDGTCVMTSTTTLTYTSTDATKTFIANEMDQSATGRHMQATLYYSLGGGLITQFWAARVIANTALTAGGTCMITIDFAAPVTNYDQVSLDGTAGGSTVVYTLYTIANAAIGAALANQFTAPQAFVAAAGNSTELVSFPVGSVVFANPTGGTAYSEFKSACEWDATSGTVRFKKPTYITAGGADPHDVRFFAAVNVGENSVAWPADISGVPQFGGTSHTVEGLQDTLTITLDAWRDPNNGSNVLLFIQEQLDAVKDAIVEGSFTLMDMMEAALVPGLAATIVGNLGGTSFPTGWETLALPIDQVEVEWPATSGPDVQMNFHCSNRRAALSAEAFLRPDRVGLTLGFSGSGGDALEVGVGDMGMTDVSGGSFGGALGGAIGSFGGAENAAFGAAAGTASGAIGGFGQGIDAGAKAFGQPGDASIPMSPADLGIPTSPGQYMQNQGLPMSPQDLGIPTTLNDIGVQTPAQYFGLDADQGQQQAPAPTHAAVDRKTSRTEVNAAADDFQAGLPE